MITLTCHMFIFVYFSALPFPVRREKEGTFRYALQSTFCLCVVRISEVVKYTHQPIFQC
jgi:hypothetical protein